MGLTWPRSAVAALAALATAGMLLLLAASVVVIVAGADRLELGRAGPLLASLAFAAVYCAALATLLGPRGGLRVEAGAATGAVVALAAVTGHVLAAAVALAAVTGLVHWGSGAPPRRRLSGPAAGVIGVDGLAALILVLAAAATPAPHRAPAPVARAAALAPAPAPQPSSPPPPPAAIVAPSPRAVVQAYYRALDAHRFPAAWRRLSPAVRARFGGFERWRAGYATTVASRPADLTVLAAAPGTALVRHRLDAVDRQPCGTRASAFTVEWRLERTAGRWRATRLTARALRLAPPC